MFSSLVQAAILAQGYPNETSWEVERALPWRGLLTRIIHENRE